MASLKARTWTISVFKPYSFALADNLVKGLLERPPVPRRFWIGPKTGTEPLRHAFPLQNNLSSPIGSVWELSPAEALACWPETVCDEAEPSWESGGFEKMNRQYRSTCQQKDRK